MCLFLSINFASLRRWQDIVKVLKEKNLKSEIVYQAKLSFRTEGKLKSLTDEQKLKEFISTKLALEDMLKGIL